MRNLADRIYTFLRDPTGEREAIAVLPLIREILKANRWNDIRVSSDKPVREQELKIYFDRHRFRSVLENILERAIIFTDRETVGEDDFLIPESNTAQELGISRRTLLYRLKSIGMQ